MQNRITLAYVVFDKIGNVWRICRRDNVLVGAYATKELAQKALNKMTWIE